MVGSLVPLAERLCEQRHSGQREDYIHLISTCAEALRACTVEDGVVANGNGHCQPHLNDLAVQVLVPAVKSVVQSLVERHENECAGLRGEISALETALRKSDEAASRSDAERAAEREASLRAAKEEVDAMERSSRKEVEALKRALEVSTKSSEKAEAELLGVRRDLFEAIQMLEDRAEGYRRMCRENRMLHETIKDLRGNILIYTRVRPRGVTGDLSECVVRSRDEECALEFRNKHGEWKPYRFDRVFREQSTQEDVYLEATSLIRSVMAGTDVTIFAYGQTGSGKTHTMQYLNRKAFEDLFRYQREDQEDNVHRRYRFKVQMLEIYNDMVNDMLEPRSTNLKIQTLSFRNEDSMTRVPDAKIVEVETIDDVHMILDKGSSNRHVGATKMNERSSRSHLIFTIMVERMEESGQVKRGRLHLIDLAGSERLNRSGAEGSRATETKAINKSLSAIGRVLASLGSNQSHVSFRDSAITRLLEDSLTGGREKSKCMMFMHVAPEATSQSETRAALEFGKGVVDSIVRK